MHSVAVAAALSLTFHLFSSVANFGSDYCVLKIKILAKRKRAITTKFAIVRNGCYAVRPI